MMSVLVFGRRKHVQAAVPSSGVVTHLDVVVDRRGELDAGSPPPAVEQLDLHAAPERLRDRVVTGVADRAERGQQARSLRRAAASSADPAASFSPRSMRSCFCQRYRHDSAIPRSFATSGTGRPDRTRSRACCRNSGGYGLGIATTSPSRSSHILPTNRSGNRGMIMVSGLRGQVSCAIPT